MQMSYLSTYPLIDLQLLPHSCSYNNHFERQTNAPSIVHTGTLQIFIRSEQKEKNVTRNLCVPSFNIIVANRQRWRNKTAFLTYFIFIVANAHIPSVANSFTFALGHSHSRTTRIGRLLSDLFYRNYIVLTILHHAYNSVPRDFHDSTLFLYACLLRS